MKKPPHPLERWIVDRCDPPPLGDDEEQGRELQRRAMRADPERFDELRFRVSHRCLVRHFRQDASPAGRLLRAEIHGDLAPASVEPDDDSDDDGLTIERVPDGGRPLAELVLLVVGELDRPGHWTAVARERPDRAIAWLAQRVFWRVRDRLRGDATRSVGDRRIDREQHRVAGWLDDLADGDPEIGGVVEAMRGVYGSVLARIVAHLDELGVGTGAPSYVLRKLFPTHAWPAEPALPEGRVGAWLRARLEALWRARVGWDDTARALGDVLGVSASPDVAQALERSAATHRAQDDFPGWTEVGLWVGDLAADALDAPDLHARLNTFQRRVGRIDAMILPFVEAQHQRLRRAAAELR